MVVLFLRGRQHVGVDVIGVGGYRFYPGREESFQTGGDTGVRAQVKATQRAASTHCFAEKVELSFV